MSNKIAVSFFIFVISFIIATSVSICVSYFRNTLDYVETDKIVFFSQEDFNLEGVPKDKNEIRADIEKLVDVPAYFYKEKRLEHAMGVCNPFISTVIISTDLTYIEYIETICHELCHMKYFTLNERFTQYKTWEILYNSDKYRPVANIILYNMSRNKYNKDYDCYYQILEYLEVL